MTWIFEIPKWLKENLPTVRRLKRRYPIAFQWTVSIIVGGAIITGVCKAFCWYTFTQPQLLIYDYLRAINERQWAAANRLLAEPLATRWSPQQMEADYDPLLAHQHVEITVSDPSQSALLAWLRGDLDFTVALDYRIRLQPKDLSEPRRFEDTLWAQLTDRAAFDALHAASPTASMEFTIVSTRHFLLQRAGFHWRIADFKKRISDGIKH